MSAMPVEKPAAAASVEKHRRTAAAALVSSPQRDRFEQALKQASRNKDDDKADDGVTEPAVPVAWPQAAALARHEPTVLHAPITAPSTSATEAAMHTSLRQGGPWHPTASTNEPLRVELADSRLPVSTVEVQRTGTRIDLALTGQTATRTDLSPVALGRLRERLVARGTDLGALTWTSSHHDEDEHDEH